MATDRVVIQDEQDALLWEELDKVDWSKILHYGTLTLKIRDDRVKFVDKGTTHKRD